MKPWDSQGVQVCFLFRSPSPVPLTVKHEPHSALAWAFRETWVSCCTCRSSFMLSHLPALCLHSLVRAGVEQDRCDRRHSAGWGPFPNLGFSRNTTIGVKGPGVLSRKEGLDQQHSLVALGSGQHPLPHHPPLPSKERGYPGCHSVVTNKLLLQAVSPWRMGASEVHILSSLPPLVDRCP